MSTKRNTHASEGYILGLKANLSQDMLIQPSDACHFFCRHGVSSQNLVHLLLLVMPIFGGPVAEILGLFTVAFLMSIFAPFFLFGG
jgi:hypothetical protein